MSQALRDLVIESLDALLPVTVIVAWVWCVPTILFAPQRTPIAYAVMALSTSACVMSYIIRARLHRLAIAVYLLGVFGSVTLLTVVFHDTNAFLLFALGVLVAATLISARALAITTVLSLGVMFAIANTTATSIGVYGLPIAIVLLTALASWLSSRRLYTALAWALSMTAESQHNAAEAQTHRGEVQRILKNLDEAYVRLEHTNEALLIARESAEKAYRFKADFVANVSHELRTPLNLIIGFSEMMATAPESYGGVSLPREYRGDVSAIFRSARHLSDLINDVLDLSQIEAGQMPIHKTPNDLGDVVRESTDIVRGLVEARGLQLIVDVPDGMPPIPLDRTRIRQVLLNLLTNATRFTDHGFIRTRVHMQPIAAEAAHDPQHYEAVISVEDSGRGIPADKLASAFEAFTQLHEDQIREGTGLGLAVSKRFVTLHGGRMWIDSQVGKGTSVCFTLPVAEFKIATETYTGLRGAHEAEPPVLVLHDDSRALVLLQRYVPGFQFVMAATLDDARRMMHSHAPAAIIADAAWMQRWPDMTRASDFPPQLPILQAPLPGLKRMSLVLGAVDYLTKPVTRESLTGAIGRLEKPPQRVLIIDDDPHIVRLLGRMLRAENGELQVFEAFGGDEGLRVAREQMPDAVLLDLLMPDVSGYDVLDAMSSDPALAHIPVIIISARGVEDEAAPVMGEIRLDRASGFSVTEMLQAIEANLNVIRRMRRDAPEPELKPTQPAERQTSVVSSPKAQSG